MRRLLDELKANPIRYEERVAELKASIEADSRKIETIIDSLIDLPSRR